MIQRVGGALWSYDADLSLRLDSPHRDTKACPPAANRLNFQFHLKERLGMDMETRRNNKR